MNTTPGMRVNHWRISYERATLDYHTGERIRTIGTNLKHSCSMQCRLPLSWGSWLRVVVGGVRSMLFARVAKVCQALLLPPGPRTFHFNVYICIPLPPGLAFQCWRSLCMSCSILNMPLCARLSARPIPLGFAYVAHMCYKTVVLCVLAWLGHCHARIVLSTPKLPPCVRWLFAGLLAVAGRQALECARFRHVACAQLNHVSAIIACSCVGVLAAALPASCCLGCCLCWTLALPCVFKQCCGDISCT